MILDFRRGYVEFLNLLIERTPRDAQSLRGLFDLPAFLLENSLNVLLLQLDEREISIAES